MSKLKIVHLAQTPLVGAPGKIARALRDSGHDACAVVLADYPKSGPLAGKFVEDSLVWFDCGATVDSAIRGQLQEADIIHIHNDLPADKVTWLREHASGARFVYQVHSPKREGPLYLRRAQEIGLPFCAHLAVAQYQPRHYPDYTPVPNLVLASPSVRPIVPGQKIKVLFSPSHTRGGRWNSKQSKGLDKAISALVGLGAIELVKPDAPLHPNALLQVRRRCHVSIDEIATGAFHQVSIEALCTGNVVINRADYFSKYMMAQCSGTMTLPPFIYADDSTIGDVLMTLAREPERVARIQQASADYFLENLAPSKLIRAFENIYETIL